MNLQNKKIIIATYGEAGVIILSKIFELNISLNNLLILTHNIKRNKRLINILKMYKFAIKISYTFQTYC